MTTGNLTQRIQHFYDASSHLWERAWGEHMHHGHYGSNGSSHHSHHGAQVNMIEQMLEWGQLDKPIDHIIDIGCGIGGSSIYLSQKFNARVTGITLSPVQALRARQRSYVAKLAHPPEFIVADALLSPFRPSTFDLVWSLESAEHIADKQGFVSQCVELLKPGGYFLMATWCHRPTPPTLTQTEREYLSWIYNAYNLPGIISVQKYAEVASISGLANIEIADWTGAIQPFWLAVIRSALMPKNIAGLFQSGWPVLKGALAMPLMIQGYKSGLLRFGLLKGKKE